MTATNGMALKANGQGSAFPDNWDADKAEQVLELISGGSTFEKIGTDPNNGFPSKNILYQWKRECEIFRDDYARAREDRADWRADKIDATWEAVEAGTLEPNSARVIIDALKWQAGKEKPRVYGDKHVIEGGDKPIEHNHSIPALETLIGKVDAIASRTAAKTIEHEPDNG